MTIPPFERHLPTTDSCILFVCDHASKALPEKYSTLGLEQNVFDTHIASDIGAGALTRVLSAEFGAAAILGRWSRLLIDLNRGEDDPTLVMKLSDGSIIPGNAGAGPDEIAWRIANYFAPYHSAIAREIHAIQTRGTVPVIISVHSFTPIWKGVRRPWDIGILWDRDGRLARPMIAGLSKAGFSVGDNEPYSGELENDTLYRHGTMLGLPHVLIEIRQDLIADDASVHAMAFRLIPVLKGALAEMGSPTVQYTRPLAASGKVTMDEQTREQLEAAVFRRLVAHFRNRTDVQNIDLMTLAGFCRNCLGDWYRDAAAEKGIALEKDAARELIYGMAPSEWKKRYQIDATPEQQAAFKSAQKTHN